MPDASTKLSSDQFAEKIKAQYPAYQNIDNATLTQKMLAKYPEYQNKVSFTPQIPTAAAPGFKSNTDLATGKPSQSIDWSNPLPAIKSIGKGVANFFTGAEQGLGKEAAAGIGAPTATKNYSQAVDSTFKNIHIAISARNRLKAEGVDTSKIDSMIKDLAASMGQGQNVESVLPSVNDTNAQILGNAAGVALDVVGAGTFGKATNTLEKMSVPELTTFLKGQIPGLTHGMAADIAERASVAARNGTSIEQFIKNEVGQIPKGALQTGLNGAEKITAPTQTGKLSQPLITTPLVGTAIQKAAKVGSSLIEQGTEKGIQQNAESTVKKIADMVSPKLTGKETAQELAARGGVKSPILGKITLNQSPYVRQIAETVQKYVPDFNTSKSVTENVNATRTAVYDLADKLKQDVVSAGKDVIYPFKELSSLMNNVEKPIAIKADSVLNKQFELAKNAALEIAKKSGGTISSLLDARKEFDQLVSKQFPNLYEKENAPMRSAITAMRNTMNDFIAEKLPDVAYKDSLKTQTHLFNAIDNMSEKAAKEVGTTKIGRISKFIKDHPVASSVGGVVGYNEAKKIPVIGGLLP